MDGKQFIDDLLHFWQDRLKECITDKYLTREEREDLWVIEGLFSLDAPYQLWEECQSGLVHKETIYAVQKVDEAIYKLKARLMPLSDQQKDDVVQLDNYCESILVFCFCSKLQKEGRLLD